MKNLQKIARRNLNSRAYYKRLTQLSLSFCIAMAVFFNSFVCAYANGRQNAENANPTGTAGNATMNTMITIVFWVVRIIIVLVAVPGIIKIVQGQADENPRDRNAGLATVGIAGAAFAGSFALRALI